MLDSSIFFDGYLLEVSFPFAVIFLFLSFYTVLTNTMVCLVYLSDRGRNLHTMSNHFIISLAVADILVGVTVEPLCASYYWSKNKAVLFAYYIFAVLSCVSSILHICAMMVDRYIAVSRPFRYRVLVSTRRVRIALAFLWILAVHFSLLPLLGWRTSGYQIYLYGLGILLPTGSMFVSYRGLLRILRRKTLNLESTQSDKATMHCLKKRFEKERRISKTVLIMMMAFLISWGPFVVLDFALVFCEVCRSPGLEIARDVTLTLGFFSSGINPLLYAWRVPQFRKGLRLLFKRRSKKRRRSNSQVCPSDNITLKRLSQAAFETFIGEDSTLNLASVGPLEDQVLWEFRRETKGARLSVAKALRPIYVM